MRKKIAVFTAVLLCLSLLTGCCFHKEWYAATCDTPKTCAECGETEGEPLGHSWVDATCETPKTCSVCHLTEGEALGHSWVDATTEAPKTCTTCAATEGERIVTDPRFTTAATRDIQGLWIADVTMTGEEIGLDPGIMDELTLRLFMDLQNDGTMAVSVQIPDEDAFMSKLIDSYVETMYAEFAGYGMDKAAADEAMLQTYGMGVREYMESTLGAISFNDLLSSIYSELNLGGIYFIQDGILYTGSSWTSAVTEEGYTLSGDTLIIDSVTQELGSDVVFTRSVG